jgi:hypothetical protein
MLFLFPSRNIKSIENHLIRKVISSRQPSPGPGQYQGLSMASSLTSTLSVPSPQRLRQSNASTAAATTDPEVRCLSPGHRGYSFGKERLSSSIGSFDASGRLITSVYEFKTSPNKPGKGGGMITGGGGGNRSNPNSRQNTPSKHQLQQSGQFDFTTASANSPSTLQRVNSPMSQSIRSTSH